MNTSAQQYSQVEPTAVRAGFSRFPQPLVLLAADVGGGPQGLVISTFTVGVSLEPPLVSVAIQHSSQTWPQLRSAERLGVSLIGDDQLDIARQLAGKDRARRFAEVGHSVHEGGALTLTGSPAWMSTRIHDQVRAGDHDVVFLEVMALAGEDDLSPAVFHRSDFKQLVDPEAE